MRKFRIFPCVLILAALLIPNLGAQDPTALQLQAIRRQVGPYNNLDEIQQRVPSGVAVYVLNWGESLALP